MLEYFLWPPVSYPFVTKLKSTEEYQYQNQFLSRRLQNKTEMSTPFNLNLLVSMHGQEKASLWRRTCSWECCIVSPGFYTTPGWNLCLSPYCCAVPIFTMSEEIAMLCFQALLSYWKGAPAIPPILLWSYLPPAVSCGWLPQLLQVPCPGPHQNQWQNYSFIWSSMWWHPTDWQKGQFLNNYRQLFFPPLFSSSWNTLSYFFIKPRRYQELESTYRCNITQVILLIILRVTNKHYLNEAVRRQDSFD